MTSEVMYFVHISLVFSHQVTYDVRLHAVIQGVISLDDKICYCWSCKSLGIRDSIDNVLYAVMAA